jgi:hypothetical protein
MRYFLHAIQLPDLIKSVDRGRETTVEAEDLALNDSSQWQVVEEFSEGLPDVRVSILSQTLIIEAIPIYREGSTRD